jgi:hypothetical protein
MICCALPRLSAIIAKNSQTAAALSSTTQVVVSRASAACSRAVAACLRYLKASSAVSSADMGVPIDDYERDSCVTIKACRGARGIRSKAKILDS